MDNVGSVWGWFGSNTDVGSQRRVSMSGDGQEYLSVVDDEW